MRILVTLPWGERLGGAETMLQAVLDGAQDSDHVLELVFLQDGGWPEELSDAGFRVEVIPAGRLRELHRWLASVRALAGVLRDRRPDLVLNWMPKTHLYGGPAALLAGMRRRVLWWQHGISDGHWTDRLATLLPAIAVGCSSQAAAAAQARLSPTRHTFVVAPGTPVPDPAPSPPPLELPEGVPVVGVVGRLQPWKGQDRVLGAQALLRERGQEIHLVIVGGDAYGLSTEYARSLPALVTRLGLDGAVTMTGQVPDAGPYIEQMDILLNVSEPEPFGVVLLEGMARGVAVVAVDSGGPREIIADRQTGLLARSGEPPHIADALQTLIGSPALREDLAAAGRERFLAEFTDVAMRRRFFAALRSLVEDPGRGSSAVVEPQHA